MQRPCLLPAHQGFSLHRPWASKYPCITVRNQDCALKNHTSTLQRGKKQRIICVVPENPTHTLFSHVSPPLRFLRVVIFDAYQALLELHMSLPANSPLSSTGTEGTDMGVGAVLDVKTGVSTGSVKGHTATDTTGRPCGSMEHKALQRKLVASSKSEA
ncbi:hypothetical protein NDU88_004856 [Pleurodeles waltl]|uniref:Uncharacterized protein n=1 Tax=Pleurodeles waltl TaxID=8319 RepID=A0AAV7T8Z9_PLEWA|nr:hypothetical protein NDU88_004856 [Pleurodeles waltl]